MALSYSTSYYKDIKIKQNGIGQRGDKHFNRESPEQTCMCRSPLHVTEELLQVSRKKRDWSIRSRGTVNYSCGKE